MISKPQSAVLVIRSLVLICVNEPNVDVKYQR